VLLTTAYLDEAERCDDVVLLHEGRLLDQGAPAVLRETMRGHTYRVTVAGMDKRVLQNRIAQAPGVMDALIQGDHVRVVMESTPPIYRAMPRGGIKRQRYHRVSRTALSR
jgi:ABC-2 type transport system ATP-binding protein